MKDFLILVALACLVVFGVSSCNNSEWNQERVRAEQARRAAAQIPHVFAQTDGCTVYTFEGSDGNPKYFTKCPHASTTTLSSHTVSSGKTLRTVQDSIEVK